MPVLSETDKDIYFPSIELTGMALEVAIANAQRLAESNFGAGRPLEVTEFTEIVQIADVVQSGQFSYVPVLADPAPVIQTRIRGRTTYGRHKGVSNWYTLPEESYILDIDGRFHLNSNYAGDFGRTGYYWADEAQLTYSSGFDFTVDSHEIQQIKTAVASILVVQRSEQYLSNVSRVEVFEEVKVEFPSGGSSAPSTGRDMLSDIGGLGLREALSWLGKYRPRGHL